MFCRICRIGWHLLNPVKKNKDNKRLKNN